MIEEVFAVTLALACGLAALALPIGLIVWAMGRPKRLKRRLFVAGEQLGMQLRVDGYRRSLHGWRDGVEVRVRHVTEGSGDNKSSWTYVEALLDPPLRLGLNARARGWLGAALGDLFGEQLTVGDVELDRSFSLRAIEASELPRFLGDAALRDIMIRARSVARRFWMTDDVVHVSFSGYTTQAGRLESALKWVVAVAKEAERARRAMGPTAREQRVIDVWTPLAQQEGWTFDRESLAMGGERERIRIQVVPQLGPKGWSTRFRAELPRPLGVDLRLSRQGTLSALGRLFGMQDIEVGDHRFDGAFVVKGIGAEQVRAVLANQQLRDRLVDLLGKARSLDVQDTHVDAVAQGLVSEARDVRACVDKVATIAELLLASVQAPSEGAYR